MKSIGNKISETRKLKGLSQEELAVMAKVSVRTVQRIENDENVPRGKTMHLLCEVLELKIEDLTEPGNKTVKKGGGAMILHGVFLIVLNVIFMAIFGFLTLDSEASVNSRLGGILLSFFLPLFVVWKTPEKSGLERFFQFGAGFLVYIVVVWTMHGFPVGLTTGLFICLGIALTVLFYGDRWVQNATEKSPIVVMEKT